MAAPKPGPKPKRGSKIALAAVAIAIAAVVISKVVLSSNGPESTAKGPSIGVDSGRPVFNDLITDENARLEYIASSVQILDLQIGPDQKPDDAGPVPGLFRVSGVIKNNGDRAISEANLMINPQDDKGQVVGSYVEDVLHGRRLGPQGSKPFSFQIPEKPSFTGKYLHRLK